MNSVVVSAVVLLALVGSTLQDNVDTKKACDLVAKSFPGGAAQMVAQLLGKKVVPAANYIQGAPIGTKDHYNNATPGDVVGFPGHLHWLAIYVGNKDCPCLFVDVPAAGANARCNKAGYGDITLYEYRYPA